MVKQILAFWNLKNFYWFNFILIISMVNIIEFSVGALQFPFISNSSVVGDLYLHLFEDAISSNPWT